MCRPPQFSIHLFCIIEDYISMTVKLSYDWCLASGATTPNPYTHDDSTNQDAYGFWVDEAGRGVIVACDGAGSLARSREGARLVADVMVSEARAALELFTPSGSVEGDSYALKELLLKALSVSISSVRGAEDFRQMGCTVAAAVFCEESFAVVTLGDAFVVVGDHSDSAPFYQSYVEFWDSPNITSFTSNDKPRILVSWGSGATWCLVSSDGLKNVMVSPASADRQEEVEGNLFVGDDMPLQLMLLSPGQAGGFLEFLESNKRLNDDTTFAIAGCLNKGQDSALRIHHSKVQVVPEFEDNNRLVSRFREVEE